jgi:hypothetical protein
MQVVLALGLSAVMSLRRYLALSVWLVCGPAAAGAPADEPGSSSPAGSRLALTTPAAQSVSMEEAVKMAEQRFHARVVKAEAQRGDGRTVYVLRLLNEAGRVWTVRVDAASGAVL